MRPYTNGAAPASVKKGKKKKANASLRSKVAEVKNRAAKLGGKREEAFASLVEEAATPAKRSPAKKATTTPKGKARMSRIKSAINSHSRLPDTPRTEAAKKERAKETRVKRLQKIKSLAGVGPSHSKLESSPRRGNQKRSEVEQACEAIELNGASNGSTNTGFLSRIWRRSSEDGQEKPSESGESSCVIS